MNLMVSHLVELLPLYCNFSSLAASVSINYSKFGSIAVLIAVLCCNAESVSAETNINNADFSQPQLIQKLDEWWLRVYGDAFYLGFTDSADLAPSRMFGHTINPPTKKNRKGISRRVSDFQTLAADFWNSKAERDRFIGAFKTGYADGCRKAKSVSRTKGGLSAFDGSLAQESSMSAKDAVLKQANRLGIQKSRATYLVQLIWDDVYRPHSKLSQRETDTPVQAQNSI